MALSFTEEVVSEYFKHILDEDGRQRYFVSEHVQYTKPKKAGWHDIDVLAIGENEICVVQTKQWANFKRNKKQSLKSIKTFFDDAVNFVKQNYKIEEKKIRIQKIFVAEMMSEPMQKDIQNLNIQTKSLKDIIKELMQTLYDRWKAEYKRKGYKTLGKEENNVTRVLLSLTLPECFEKELRHVGILE